MKQKEIEFKSLEGIELNKMVDEWYLAKGTSPFIDISLVEGGEEGEISIDMDPEFGKKVKETFGDKEEEVLGDYIGALLKSFIDDLEDTKETEVQA